MNHNSIDYARELEQSGRWGDSVSLLKKLVRSLKSESRADALLLLGKVYKYQGEFHSSIKTLKTAELIFAKRKLHDKARECRLQRAINFQYLGEYDVCEKIFYDLKEFALHSSNDYLLSHCCMQLGILNRIHHRYSTAMRELKKCEAIKRRTNKIRDLAATVEQIGIVHERLHRYPIADTLYKESLELKKKIRYVRGVGTYHLRMGVLRRLLKKYSKARSHLSRSLGLRVAIADKIGIGSSLYELAKIEQDSGNYDYAEYLAFGSLSFREGIKDRRRLGNTYFLLARLLFHNNKSAYKKYIGLAERLRRYLRHPIDQIETLKTRLDFSIDSAPSVQRIENEIGILYESLDIEQKKYYKP